MARAFDAAHVSVPWLDRLAIGDGRPVRVMAIAAELPEQTHNPFGTSPRTWAGHDESSGHSATVLLSAGSVVL
jgi:hypothetical protein